MSVDTFVHVNCLSEDHLRQGKLPETWQAVEFSNPEVMTNSQMDSALTYLLPDFNRDEIKQALENPNSHIYLVADLSEDPLYNARIEWLRDEFKARKTEGPGGVEFKTMA